MLDNVWRGRTTRSRRSVELGFAVQQHRAMVHHLAKQILTLQDLRLVGDVDGGGGGVGGQLRPRTGVRGDGGLDAVVFDQDLEVGFPRHPVDVDRQQASQGAPQEGGAQQVAVAKSDGDKLF